MGAGRVAVVAAWQGWCGACADERPLVLTRSGRRTLRSWWGGLGDDHLALTLTCRLCGVGVDVPLHEEDDVDPVDGTTDLRSVEDPQEAVAVEVEDLPTRTYEAPAAMTDGVTWREPGAGLGAADEGARAGHQAVADVLAALVRRQAAPVLPPAPRSPSDSDVDSHSHSYPHSHSYSHSDELDEVLALLAGGVQPLEPATVELHPAASRERTSHVC